MALFSINISGAEIKWFTLAFPEELEKDFLKDYADKSLTHTRVALVLAIFFYGFFGFLDAWLVPQEKFTLWFIRFVVFIPYSLLVLFFSFTKNFKKYLQPVNASVILLAGVGIVVMVLIAPFPANVSYYAGLILVFIFGYTFFKLRFVWATITGWMLVAAYEFTAIVLSDTPIPSLINNNFFFLTGNVLGMFACYSIEFYLRKEYIQSRMLEIEKSKVNAANLELEKRVAERTSQLVIMNKDLQQEILERKRSTEALKVSEEKYRTILESMQEGYFEVDLTGKLKFFNKSAANILGFSMQEMQNLGYHDFTTEETAKEMFKVFNELYVTGKPQKVMDFGIIRKDGEKRILSFSTSLTRDLKGEPIGFRGIARDDTVRKEVEEKVRQMNVELEQRVAKRTEQLNEVNLELKKSLDTVQKTQAHLVQTEKLASLGGLVAGVAHEINTPVGIAVTASSLLDEKNSDINRLYSEGKMKRSDLDKYFRTVGEISASILSNLNRAADLIRSFKQIAVDQSSEGLRKFCLKNCIDNVLLSLRPKLKKTNNIVNVICPDEIEINSYPGALSQIVTNLIMNSLLHGFYGIEKGEINIEFTLVGPDCRMLYRDNGVGMDEETRRHIFDPFFTTKRTSGGTGLGMHIVFNLVTQTFKGKITCESEPGKGTLIEIMIPSDQEVSNG